MHIKHFQWIHDIIKNIAFLCALLYISLVVIPQLQRSWKGSILVPPCPSVGPSVRFSARPSVCGQNRVRSVSSTILARSISCLHILSCNFRRCVTCFFFKIKKFEVFKFVTLTLSYFDLRSILTSFISESKTRWGTMDTRVCHYAVTIWLSSIVIIWFRSSSFISENNCIVAQPGLEMVSHGLVGIIRMKCWTFALKSQCCDLSLSIISQVSMTMIGPTASKAHTKLISLVLQILNHCFSIHVKPKNCIDQISRGSILHCVH